MKRHLIGPESLSRRRARIALIMTKAEPYTLSRRDLEKLAPDVERWHETLGASVRYAIVRERGRPVVVPCSERVHEELRAPAFWRRGDEALIERFLIWAIDEAKLEPDIWTEPGADWNRMVILREPEWLRA